MAIGGAGRIIPDRVAPKKAAPAPAPKPSPAPAPVKQTAQFTKAQIEAKERAAAKPAPVAKASPISADNAERRIEAARAKAIADVKKGPTTADAAERRIQNAVNKEIASITGKAPIKPTPKPIVTKKPVVTTNPKTPPVKKPSVILTPPPIVNDPAPTVINDIFPYPDSGYASQDPVTTPPPVKSAPIDTVIFVDETFSKELITDLLFEDVGGQELLTIARNDTVNGQLVAYQPFKNLDILQEIYNPTTLLRLQETSDKFFSNFTINLRDKIPKVGSGTGGVNYYLDLSSGEGVIEFINLRADEQIEIQIAGAGIIEDVGI